MRGICHDPIISPAARSEVSFSFGLFYSGRQAKKDHSNTERPVVTLFYFTKKSWCFLELQY